MFMITAWTNMHWSDWSLWWRRGS